MANDTAVTAPAVRGTGSETFSVSITPVDEKRFESEIRRIDTSGADEKKNREKFETRIEKSVSDLRSEMNSRFEKVDAQFEKADNEFKTLRGEMKDLHGEMRDLRGEMRDLRGEMNARMDRLDDRIWWIFGAVVLSILLPVVMKYL